MTDLYFIGIVGGFILIPAIIISIVAIAIHRNKQNNKNDNSFFFIWWS